MDYQYSLRNYFAARAFNHAGVWCQRLLQPEAAGRLEGEEEEEEAEIIR
jgi:hypothetical protein